MQIFLFRTRILPILPVQQDMAKFRAKEEDQKSVGKSMNDRSANEQDVSIEIYTTISQNEVSEKDAVYDTISLPEEHEDGDYYNIKTSH